MPRKSHISEAQLKHADGQTQSLLFKLPAELRTTIYELVLKVHPTINGQVVLWRYHRSDVGRHQLPRTPSVLSLLATCRAIYNEAAAIFYHINQLKVPVCGAYGFSQNGCSQNGFRLKYNLSNFVSLISPLRLSGIRHLTFRLQDSEAAGIVFRAITRLSSLQSLRVDWRSVIDPLDEIDVIRMKTALKKQRCLQDLNLVVRHRPEYIPKQEFRQHVEKFRLMLKDWLTSNKINLTLDVQYQTYDSNRDDPSLYT